MKLLYAARMARYDLLRAIQGLASKLTRWDPDCDAALERLVSYVNSSLDLRLSGWVGDSLASVQLRLFADADFAGDKVTMRSTSGVFFALVGGSTSFPLSAASKRQSSVSQR